MFRRLREFTADRWFELLLWLRYDMSWRVVAPLLVLFIFFVGFVGVALSPFSVNLSAESSATPPARLPDVVPLPERVFPARAPVSEVLVIGDSLVAGEEGLYREALASVGVVSFFDAAVSRGLRYGWLCPAGVAAPVGAPMADEFSEPGFAESASETAEVVGTGIGPGESVDESAAPDTGDDASSENKRSSCVRQGLEAAKWYAAVDALPQVVVVALGTNDASSPPGQVRARLDDLRTLLEGRRVVLLETATYPMTGFHAGWNDTARSWCLADVSCRFVDWARDAGSPEFFASDGLHLSASGSLARAEALASLLAVGY